MLQERQERIANDHTEFISFAELKDTRKKMILYKYASYDAGIKIIENNNIGFSQPHHFNDPFELEASYPSDNNENPVTATFNDIRRSAKKDTWKQNTAILSLSRQPLNPLMWAHYSGAHTGFVIGFDVAIEEFTCEESNLIPVQYGSVIYTNKKPDAPFLSNPEEPLEVGGAFNFRSDQIERLQRKFLFKPACWAYEEEVRIVKCIKGIEDNKILPSGTFSEIEVQERPLYLLHLPKGAIKEVYMGVRLGERTDMPIQGIIAKIKQMQPGIKIFGCKISKHSWDLESCDIEKTSF
ncbi:MAG: DUF2971 domain-containing protein [Bacteroidota bacterium]